GSLRGIEFLDCVEGQQGTGISGAIRSIQDARLACGLSDRGDAFDPVQVVAVLSSVGVRVIAGSSPWRSDDSGAQLQQSLKVSPIQRQLVQLLARDGATKLGIRRIHERNLLGDRDGLGLLAGTQLQVNANGLTDFHEYPGSFERAETGGFSA